MSVIKDLGLTTLGLAESVKNLAQHGRHDSLVGYTKSTRVEPMCMVESSLQNADYIEDVLQTATTLVAGYYLQAVAISLNVGNVNIIKLLDGLNPNRDPLATTIDTGYTVGKHLHSLENYAFGLPRFEKEINPSIEARQTDGQRIARQRAATDAADRKRSNATYEPRETSVNETSKAGQITEYGLGKKIERELEDAADKKRMERKKHALELSKLKDKNGQHAQDLEHKIKQLDQSIAQHDDQQKENKKNRKERDEQRKYDRSRVKNGFGKDTVKQVLDNSNLCVGKLLEVEVESNGNKATIPVQLRLNTKVVGSDNIIHILTADKKDHSAKGIYRQWRGGEIRFIQDVLLADNIIMEHKKTAITDKSGIYLKNMERKSKNKFAGLISMNPSVNQASSIVIITQDTADRVASELGGKLSNERMREKFMTDTSTMILIIIDVEWERAEIYTKTISDSIDIRVKDMKNAGSNKGPDVGEILKAYQLGNSPSTFN